MGSNRPTNGWATANDWANHQPLITALYRDQNKTLKETMEIMEKHHNFFATIRMYKARFQQWGIEKKIKAGDAVEIFRQQTARAIAGKPSVAYIRGRKINADRLQRYRYRAAALVSEQILRAEREPAIFSSEVSPPAPHIVCRTPSPTPEDPPTLTPQLQDPVDLRVPLECMQILRNYIAGSVEAGVWQVASTAPVPDAFAWAHYLATAKGLIVHNRMSEGFAVLNICLEQYKCHLRNPDPFFWLATYKAALLLAHKDAYLGDSFIDYASKLTSIILPPTHPFNRVWSRIVMTGLPGLQQHAARLFESYLDAWKEQVGLKSANQTGLIQMAFVFIQLQCSGMVSYAFTREAMAIIMPALSCSVSSQFLLQEAKFRMACSLLEQDKLDDADAVTREIMAWVNSLQENDYKNYSHLQCKCLWTMFEIEEKKGNVKEAALIGHSLVDFCCTVYGPVHLQTIDAISALLDFHTRNNNTGAARKVAEQFDKCWAGFNNKARVGNGFPHPIEQPWLHRSIELDEDEKLIQEVVDLLEHTLDLGDN
ncbi:hypothetical protein F4802DRAFT_413259 [Xylaria palmicola]|nr:hypothetical protein F4802DRAFT_413259 [Xylaria palmicola]